MRADPSHWRALGIGMAMAVELFVLSWAGWTAGAWLDARLGSEPWFGAVLAVVGMSVAAVLAVRMAQRLQAGDE